MLSNAQLVSTAVLLLASTPALAQYTATYTPQNAPDKSEDGQTGTNACGTTDSQDSMCQNAYINSVSDFCLWAPPSTTSDYGSSAIGNTERIEVAWCTQGGRGTRIIPAGTIQGAHFVITPNFAQVTGYGDLTKLNIPAGDDGGELDPHGADGNGNPIGGLVFSSAFGGGLQQVHEWTNFMSSSTFCFRACTPGNEESPLYCQHIYDTLGCGFTVPGSFDAGFTECQGDSGEKPGIYTSDGQTSTFHQGDPMTPDPHPAGATSSCQTVSTIGGSGVGDVQAILPTSSAVADSAVSSIISRSPSSAAVSSSAMASASSSSAMASSTSSSASSSTMSSSAMSSSTRSSSMMSSSRSSGGVIASASSRVSGAAASASSAVSGGEKSQTGLLVGSAFVGIAGIVGAFFL